MAEIISYLTVIFVASAIMLAVANRFNQPAVPAYLTAGILAGMFVDQSKLIGLAEIGIAFLVFIFGLKFDPEKITSVRNEALAVNSLQILLIGALSFSFASILKLPLLQSLYFSIAATFSSSLVGLELVSEEVDKNLIHGRLAESINLIQDLFAVAAVVIISTAGFLASDIVLNLGMAASMLLAALFIRKFVFDKLGKLADGSTELLTLTSLSVLTGFIGVSEYLDLSIVVGSFAAGIAVARFPHNLEILDSMGSIKDFFSAIFFVTLGALLSVPTLQILVLAAGLVMLSAAVGPFLMVMSLIHQGYDPRTSFLTGASLDQISEFALIAAIQGWISGIIAEPVFHSIVLAATVTMTTSSYTKLYEHELYEFLSRYNIIESEDVILPESNTDPGITDHIILIGYDVQGKRVVEQLEHLDNEFVVIENDPEKITDLRKRDENFVYGNILNEDTWQNANPEEASLIISTAPFKEVSYRVLELETDASKILRTEELEDARRLMEQGADYVIVPEILTAELIKEHLLGLESEENYKEELRRRSLLEVRRYLDSEEG